MMKKVVSLILVAVMAISICVPALAANDSCNCGNAPVVFVPGFGESIYENPESDDRSSVFPPSEDAIKSAVPDILKAAVCLLAFNDYEGFGTNAIAGADKLLGSLALNLDGTPVKNTGAMPNPAPEAEKHKITEYCFMASPEYETGDYKFIYDWRLDPIDNAKLLKEYVNEVKEATGHSKVILSCHSQGNTIVASYLHLFGSDDVEKLVFLSPAYKGLSLIGSLLTLQVGVSGKGEKLEEFIKSFMGYDNAQSQLIASVVDILRKAGVVNSLLDYVQKLLDEQLDRIFKEYLVDAMGTMPGVWSFVPDEYYEQAKAELLGDSEKYAELIRRADYYHYNVQNKLEDILTAAKKNGVSIVISVGCGISTIPVTTAKTESHSDMLIDTKYMSIGATCAPFGETLGDGYVQKNTSCGHNHVSPDNTIDASTCLFPEYTWYIFGSDHNQFGEDYLQFLKWAILYDGQPTVHSNEKYPQFMKVGENKELLPADGPRPAETRSNLEIIVSSVVTLLKDSIRKK